MVPNIRAGGFDGDWKERKLGELYTERNEHGNDSLQILSVSIHDGVSDGELDEEGLGKVIRRSKDKSTYKHVYEGDLVFNMMRAWQGAIGVVKSEGMISPAYISAVPNEEVYPPFMDYALRRKDAISQINNLSYGVTDFRKRLYWDSFVKVRCSLPSVEEQKRITSTLESLDSYMTLCQRKCDGLKELKKYMLLKMFPKNGEKVPEIRVPGFSDPWEQRKLESLCDVFTDGDWIEAKDQSNAGVRLVQTGNVGTTEYLDKENNKKWISEETFERLHCEEIYEGDILISRLPEPAGRACIIPNLGTRMITAVDCTIVRTAKEFDSKYLVQYLSTPTYFKVVNSFLGGGTRQRISRGNLSGIDIPIPSTLEEQKRIGEYFTNLDTLITLHQREHISNIIWRCNMLEQVKNTD